MPRLVKLSCGYCIYVLNLKPLKHFTKAFPCHIKSEKLYHNSYVFHGSFRRAAICSLSHSWAVLKNRYFRPWYDVSYVPLQSNELSQAGVGTCIVGSNITAKIVSHLAFYSISQRKILRMILMLNLAWVKAAPLFLR